MVPSVKLWWEGSEFCMQVTDEGGWAAGRIEENFRYLK